MPHPLVLQLRFTRNEFKRGLRGVPAADGTQRVGRLNSLGWSVGHLAWQEQKYFLYWGSGQMPYPDIDTTFRPGAPATTPDLSEMLAAWVEVTRLADPWLDTLTTADLLAPYSKGDTTTGGRLMGNLLQRTIYHYWYHLGENMAARKLMGHEGLGRFVGNIDGEATYTPEGDA
ncbi:MAG TPA: DinB family protein [Trueperaceae bacterium]|nr:DinB family protein [Trueperaceae bacterium]